MPVVNVLLTDHHRPCYDPLVLVRAPTTHRPGGAGKCVWRILGDAVAAEVSAVTGDGRRCNGTTTEGSQRGVSGGPRPVAAPLSRRSHDGTLDCTAGGGDGTGNDDG